MIWYYDNMIWDSALSASTSVRGYGVSQLKDYSPLTKLKFTGKDSEDVIADLGTAKEISAVAIGGHNFTEDAIITLEGNSADSWSSPPFSISLTWRALIVGSFETETYRYWRIVIEDTTNPNNLEIGIWYLGKALPIAYVDPASTVVREDSGPNVVTRSGQVVGHTAFQAYQLAYVLPSVNNDMRKTLESVYEIHGRDKPFVMLVWEDSLDELKPLYMAFTMDQFGFKRNAQSGLDWNTSFECREVL